MFYSHTQARAKLPKKRRRIMPVEHLPRSLAIRSNPNQLHHHPAAAVARAPATLAAANLPSPITGSNFALYAPGLSALSSAAIGPSFGRQNIYSSDGPTGPTLIPRGATLDPHHTRARINLSNKELLPDCAPPSTSTIAQSKGLSSPLPISSQPTCGSVKVRDSVEVEARLDSSSACSNQMEPETKSASDGVASASKESEVPGRISKQTVAIEPLPAAKTNNHETLAVDPQAQTNGRIREESASGQSVTPLNDSVEAPVPVSSLAAGAQSSHCARSLGELAHASEGQTGLKNPAQGYECSGSDKCHWPICKECEAQSESLQCGPNDARGCKQYGASRQQHHNRHHHHYQSAGQQQKQAGERSCTCIRSSCRAEAAARDKRQKCTTSRGRRRSYERGNSAADLQASVDRRQRQQRHFDDTKNVNQSSTANSEPDSDDEPPKRASQADCLDELATGRTTDRLQESAYRDQDVCPGGEPGTSVRRRNCSGSNSSRDNKGQPVGRGEKSSRDCSLCSASFDRKDSSDRSTVL